MGTTVDGIVKAAIQRALNLPSLRIQRDLLEYAVGAYNLCGSRIWNNWPWDNSKMEEIEEQVTENGIVVLPYEVDAIRAVFSTGSMGERTRISNFDEVTEATGSTAPLSSAYYSHLPDNENGQRRIKLSGFQHSTVSVLCLKRFIKAHIRENYSSANPSATPDDYRVLTWPLDRAEMDLVDLIADDIRVWRGLPPRTSEDAVMKRAISREQIQQPRDARIVPQSPSYSEAGNWW